MIVHATDRGSQRVSFDLNGTEKSPAAKDEAADEQVSGCSGRHEKSHNEKRTKEKSPKCCIAKWVIFVV